MRPSRVQAPDPKEKYQNVSTLERAPAACASPAESLSMRILFPARLRRELATAREQDCADERQKRYVRHDEAKPVGLAR